MTEFLPFALPDIGEDEINEVVDSLRSGWLTTQRDLKQNALNRILQPLLVMGLRQLRKSMLTQSR